jgi:hypothetical protein
MRVPLWYFLVLCGAGLVSSLFEQQAGFDMFEKIYDIAT